MLGYCLKTEPCNNTGYILKQVEEAITKRELANKGQSEQWLIKMVVR